MQLVDALARLAKRNYRVKKILYNLLRYPIFTENPLYLYLYMLNVRRKVGPLEVKPTCVIVENTNYCNISCIFCAHEQMKRKRGFIKRSLFGDIVDQCANEEIPHLLIQGYGEPLMDRDYISKVEYAKSKGIKNVDCVTNGILLDERTSKGLIKARLDNLFISIDAVTSETYGRIHRTIGSGRPSGMFDRLMDNIYNLVRLKNAYGSEKPFIQVRFRDFYANKGELNDFVQKFSGLVDDVNVYMNITNWVGSDIESSLPRNAPFLKFPCYNLWSTMFVAYDGRVPLCCQDYECKVELGDLSRQLLMEIWTGETLRNLRKLHMKREFDGMLLCEECTVNTHYVTPWWEWE